MNFTSIRINIVLVYFNLERCLSNQNSSVKHERKRVMTLNDFGEFQNFVEEYFTIHKRRANECRCFVVISEFFIEAVCGKVVYQPLRSFVNHPEWNIVQYSPESVKSRCLFILLKRLVVTLSKYTL